VLSQDWLSLSEIARLWSEETGESANALERDLETWFSDYVDRPPSSRHGSPGRAGDTTNSLMGLLGGRHLQRETLALYCEERGRAWPRFWIDGNGEDKPLAEATASQPIVRKLATSQPTAGGPAAGGPTFDNPRSDPADKAECRQDRDPLRRNANPSEPNPEPLWPNADRLWPSSDPQCPNGDPQWPNADSLEPNSDPLRPNSAPPRPASDEAPPGATAWPRPFRLAVGRRLSRKTVRLAGGLALGLALLALGYLLGQGGSEASPAGPRVAELGAARQRIADLERLAQAAKAEADVLADELDRVRERGAMTDQDAAARVEQSRQRLVLAAQIASRQAALSQQELAAARARLAHAEAEGARLAGELAETRRLQEAELGSATVESDGARRDLALAAQAASVHAKKLSQDLDAAQSRIADLEAQARAARAEAASLAGQLDDARGRDAATQDRLRAEAAARERELDAARERIAGLEAALQAAGAAAEGPSDGADAAFRPAPEAARPNIALTAPATPSQAAKQSGKPLDLLADHAHRQVAIGVAAPAPRVPAEAVDVDRLVDDPGRYDARQVVVTGSLIRLLQHYRLQSESGLKTLVVDVNGLQRGQSDQLRRAIAGAGLVGSVRAQISGTVERGAAKTFRLVASDLQLVE
jgi:hypothetical protein